jgi:hypothetical protein
MILFLRALGIISALSALAGLSSAIIIWNQHGARHGFWETSVKTTREIPIIEGMPELGFQQQVIWEDKLVLGIETLISGIIIFIVFMSICIVSFLISSKLSKKIVE